MLGRRIAVSVRREANACSCSARNMSSVIRVKALLTAFWHLAYVRAQGSVRHACNGRRSEEGRCNAVLPLSGARDARAEGGCDGSSGRPAHGNAFSSLYGAGGFGSLVALTVGLALLDTWGDMKGSLPVLLASNQLIGDVFVNGRMVGLAGIATCLFLIVLKPMLLVRYEVFLR